MEGPAVALSRSCPMTTAASDVVPRPANPNAVVSAREIARRYGEGESAVDALRGVSLDVPRGQFTAVMGPSGSGKSTLMHLLAGLDTPSSGTVHIGGQDITSMGDRQLTRLRRTHIGFVFQSFNLLPTLTAEENVALPLAIAGRKPDRAALDALLERMGLSGRRRARVAARRGRHGRPDDRDGHPRRSRRGHRRPRAVPSRRPRRRRPRP